MATIEFSAYRIAAVRTRYSDAVNRVVTSVTIALDIGQDPPFPRERIEATQMPAIREAFEVYATKAASSGKKLQVHARVVNGRSPPGFKAARLEANVNV